MGLLHVSVCLAGYTGNAVPLTPWLSRWCFVPLYHLLASSPTGLSVHILHCLLREQVRVQLFSLTHHWQPRPRDQAGSLHRPHMWQLQLEGILRNIQITENSCFLTQADKSNLSTGPQWHLLSLLGLWGMVLSLSWALPSRPGLVCELKDPWEGRMYWRRGMQPGFTD